MYIMKHSFEAPPLDQKLLPEQFKHKMEKLWTSCKACHLGFPLKLLVIIFSFFDLWPACLTCYLLGHKSKGGNLHNILLSWLVSGSIIIIEIMSWLSFCWMQGFAPPAYNPTGGYYMPPTPAQAAYPVMSSFVQ